MNYKSTIALIITLFVGFPVISMAKTVNNNISVEQAQSGGKILGTLVVLNKNEIAAGNLAIKKTSNNKVKNFASFMIKEHTANLKKTESLSHKLGMKIIDDQVAMKLKNKGKKELASLNKLQDGSFDKAYIKAMVKGHKEALNLVNTLISKAANPLIKKHLESTKIHVEHHLEKAQTIERSFQ
jgi:putative membrane protein